MQYKYLGEVELTKTSIPMDKVGDKLLIIKTLKGGFLKSLENLKTSIKIKVIDIEKSKLDIAYF